jgi:hypothetical protein
MFERIIEKIDLKKFNFDEQTHKVLSEFLNRDEYVEILSTSHSLLGLKEHSGKEILYALDEDNANRIRIIRDELGDWQKFVKMPLTSERQFRIHVEKLSLCDHVRKKIGNINFNKPLIKKKISAINGKITKTHERLQGVFVFHSNMADLLAGFDSRSAVFACKMSENIDLEQCSWISSVKKASIVIFCHDEKEIHNFLLKNNCEKLKVGRQKNKNIWIRKA